MPWSDMYVIYKSVLILSLTQGLTIELPSPHTYHHFTSMHITCLCNVYNTYNHCVK